MTASQPGEEVLFNSARLIGDAVARAQYLRAATGSDEALLRRVEALLAVNDTPDRLLDQPAVAAASTEAFPPACGDEAAAVLPREAPGTLIGPYKLLEQIGEGGMGDVWMAEQSEPIQRRVAVKVIKAGMDSKQVLARFDAERQALALMDHPNIAKVLDAGATATGRPYFVMELVKGTPITRFCDEKKLNVRERLDLFGDVCRAVQHAHQKGIIHRDIKPSNVLVAPYDGRPVVKVIDFGVAKATGQKLTEATLFTGFGAVVGTPEYMSPEQAEVNNQDIDTRSDIYSLGVLLYELLTGSTPLTKKRVKEAAFLEVLRVIREEEPPKPSTRLSGTEELPSISAQRHTEPAKLTKLVRGELDWIVMKALEKDRSRRYETANGFAMDVQRYLADEAVQACPPSAGYRLRKFTRRNKRSLAAAAVLALALLVAVGTVAASFGWRARERAERQTQLAAQVDQILGDADRLMQDQKWPEALAAAQRAEAVLAGGDAGETTRRRVGDLLKDLKFIDRLEQIRMARAMIVGGKFDDAGAERHYAEAFRQYGVEIDELPAEVAIPDLKVRPALAIPLAAALDDWVEARWSTFKDDVAGQKRLVAVARGIDPNPLRDRLRAAWGQPVTPNLQAELRQLAESIDVREQHPATLESLARALQRAELMDSALAMLHRAQVEYPGDFWLNFALGLHLSDRKDHEGSIRFYTGALAIRPHSSVAHNNLGIALYDQKKLPQAIAAFRKAIKIDATSALAYSNLGNALRDQEKLPEAIDACNKAIEIDSKFANAYNNLGNALYDQKKLPQAIAAFRNAIRFDPKLGVAFCNLGNALRDQKNYPEAIACYKKANELDPNDAEAHHALSLALRDQGKLDEAIASVRSAIELDPKRANFYTTLGASLADQGKFDEAIAWFKKAIELDPKNAHAYSALGWALSEQKKSGEAIDACRMAIELDPKLSDAHNNLGHALHGQMKVDAAIDAYKKAIELNPKYATAYRNLGVALCDQKKLDEAIACFRRAIELDPKYALAHVNLGYTLHDQGKFDEAIASHGRAIELDPKLASAHINLGLAHAAQSNFDAAVACLRTAIELDPTNASAHRALGFMLQRTGKLDEAIASYRTAIKLDPNYAMAHNDLGNALFHQGKVDEAVICFRSAIKFDPSYVLAYANLGSALARQNKAAEAIAAYRECLKLDPNHLGAITYLAWKLATAPDGKLRDPKLAVSHAKKATELQPTNSNHWSNLGVAQYRAGDYPSALAALEKSVEIRKRDDDFHRFFLAMTCWQLGQQDRARQQLALAVKWQEANHRDNEVQLRFRKEAEELIKPALDDSRKK